MNRFKRQISPGAAVFIVVIVLAIVQWSWWRGLIYKAPGKGPGGGPSPGRIGPQSLVLHGREYAKVDTLAGGLEPGAVDGPGYAARMDRPTGLAIDNSDKLYVCDTGNHRIRIVSADGSVSTFAGSVQGFADGPVARAKFNAPCGICASPNGDLFVADTGNGRIRRIHDGMVTTIAQQSARPGGASLPIAIAYQPGTTPTLLVLDAGLKTISTYNLDGLHHVELGKSESVAIAGDVVNSSYKATIPAVVQIDGTDELQDVAARPVVRHLTGWCRIGAGMLITDAACGAVFYKKHEVAEILAGIVDSGGPIRDWRDGTGATSLFGAPTCVVTDGVRNVYVSDTANNCIRRITLPDFMFK